MDYAEAKSKSLEECKKYSNLVLGGEFETDYEGTSFQITFDLDGNLDSVRTVNTLGPSYWHDVEYATGKESEFLKHLEECDFKFVCVSDAE